MNWISNVVRPKIRSFLNRRESPENLWIKCPESGQLVFFKDVEANQFVIPSSNYHMRMGAAARLKSIFDEGAWEDIAVRTGSIDPLRFRDERRYADRLKDARTKTGLTDAIKVGHGKLEGTPVTIAVQDFDFMGGSLGMAAGEAVIRGLETAVDKGTPFASSATSVATALTVRGVALPFLSRLSLTALTSAEPTTTPSAPSAMARACFAVRTPKPTATGSLVWRLMRVTAAWTLSASGAAAPVIPVIET